MRSNIVIIELEGVRELAQKLGDPKLALEFTREVLEGAVEKGEDAAMAAIEGGTGLARRSIGSRVRMRAKPASGVVYTAIRKRRAMSIDQGRKAGERVSVPTLAAWSARSTRRVSMTMMPREQVWQALVIQRAIKQHGTKGKGYIVATRTTIDRELPRLKRTAMRHLEKRIRS